MSNYQPIEIPRGRKYGNNYYSTYSKKLNRNVSLYSQLEYHNFLTIEMNPHVIDFCEQPLEINVKIDNKIEKSIFDMWVSYDNGREEFQEVKYKKEIDIHTNYDNRAFHQIEKQKLWCEINNYDYIIRTDNDIYLGPFYISNLRFLHGLIIRNEQYFYEGYLKQIILHISYSKVTILYLTQTIDLPIYTLFTSISFGIYTGRLTADLYRTVFSHETSIWIT